STPQDAGAGSAKRHLHGPRSNQRKEPGHQRLCRRELDEGARCQGAADSRFFYVNAKQGYSVTYLTDNDPEPQGYGGGGGGGFSEPILEAIDYKTGNLAWKHKYPSGGFGNSFPGILTTAGKLLFTGDPSGNLL